MEKFLLLLNILTTILLFIMSQFNKSNEKLENFDYFVLLYTLLYMITQFLTT